jgi:RsiW-degrading membrane proteinase PrsW (M82 family)
MGQLLLLLGALPALLVMWYFDRLDAKRPEPRGTLRKVTLAGAIAFIPCVLVEVLLLKLGPKSGYALAIFKGFLVAAAVEEGAKVLCMRWFVWNRPEFDERMDGITYATRAGLGFALVENIGYLLGQKGLATIVLVFILRAVLAVPGHAIYAGIMGYCASKKRFDGTGPGLFVGYLIAVFMHGTYDSALFVALEAHAQKHDGLALVLLPIPLVIIVVGGVILRGMVTWATAADDAAEAAARRAMPNYPAPTYNPPPYGPMR